MSVLKGILHHWNKTTRNYDIIHPETESARVTDWNQGIVNTLASTALGTLVNTLTSDSLLATMIQKVLTATGVKYSMGENGYICFGALFGNSIIQWGNITGVAQGTAIPLPVTVSTIRAVVCMDTAENDPLILATTGYTTTSFAIYGQRISATTNIWAHWIAICE